MKVNKIFERIAKSKPGQKVYKWCADGNHDKFLNNTLPQIETIVSSGCYIVATAQQHNLNKDEKKLLQYQNVLSGVGGVVIGSALNRGVSKLGENVIKDLDPKKLDPKTIRKVSTGLRIMLPLAVTGILMRFAIPTLISSVSSKMMDKEREKRAQQKLNVQA